MKGRVLIVAGSDSGGGAGIQADIKTVTALDGYAATAITALTAQDTRRVYAIHPVPPFFVALQMRAVLDDIGADAIKIGMLGDAATVEAVAEIVEAHPGCKNIVLDPVMISKSGARLLDRPATERLKSHLILRADLLTPNVPEAETLTGLSIRDLDGMRRAAEMLLSLGARAILLKGGHLPGSMVHDVLCNERGTDVFAHERVESRNTHGTGCTLASAIATGLAQGMTLADAVVRARGYVRRAIETAPGLGAGNGPLNHAHPLRP